MSIKDLGWNAYFHALWNESDRGDLAPARVVAQRRGLWRVAGDFGECSAEPSGKFRHSADSGLDWPAVGDWVAVNRIDDGSNAIIQEVLRRRSKFARKAAGKSISAQIIAANIDVALIVTALDGDFKLRRIERYIAQCWESSARPAIVLNKADTCTDPQEYASAVEGISIGAPVFVLSAKTGQGLEAFEASFAREQTFVFLGSSGVGKSTLLNWLLREDRQATQPVRESDSRGCHTTTARQLFVMPNGALIIDTPGLRELQLWNESGDLSQTFADIEELAQLCRFRDCRHKSEPACAVQAALASGQLDAARLENMRKLDRECEFLLRKVDPEKRREEKNRNRISHRRVREMYKVRDKGKT